MKISALLLTGLMFGACACQANISVGGNTPSPSPSVIKTSTNTFAFPLSLSLMPECVPAEQSGPVKQYEVLADGSFAYPVSEENPNFFEEPTKEVAMATAQLTSEQMANLTQLLKTQDIATAFDKTTAVPADSPQTAECRTVSLLDLKVNGEKQTYALNGRERNTTEDYRNRWQAIRDQLLSLAKQAREKTSETPISTEPMYAFPPFKLEAEGECGLGKRVVYEVKAFNQFVAYDTEGKVTVERELKASEQQMLTAALKSADLNTRLEKSEAVPADAPQTRECRVVDQLTLSVYGIPKTFDRNGRSFRHTEEYVAGFNAIKDLLEGFAE